ncbi:hypothetical protein OJAV_G00095580 [Oryzias javanicus]|uniref:Lipoxygenase domain-containing protein n=1 Tax=Oryzias javanicus TaxID=123683 RepID=A0A3S2MX62_ORYJA|nr:hypothetical protein OJAV_G00095580 [Oryzias javanicus]
MLGQSLVNAHPECLEGAVRRVVGRRSPGEFQHQRQQLSAPTTTKRRVGYKRGELLGWCICRQVLQFPQLSVTEVISASGENMAVEYEVTIFTVESLPSWSLYKSLSITLEGTKGKSDPTCYRKFNLPLFGSSEIKFPLKCNADLGHLLDIKLEHYWSTPFHSPWYHVKVEVESPIGSIFKFPIHQSISSGKEYFFREGKAMLPQKEKNEELIKHRQTEIKDQQKVYGWKVYEEGMPHCLEADTPPVDETFSLCKGVELLVTGAWEEFKLTWTQHSEHMDALRNLDQVEDLLKQKLTKKSEYIMNNWKKDSFFGSQFLNGLNPMVIRRIDSLPKNLSVKDDMVIPNSSDTLKCEMQKGNIFLCDYSILDGVEANTINGKKQYLTAPLVLLHKNQKDEMMPIAIQLKQKPGQDNPVFFPSDSENDWLLAKLYVRSADFNLHELNYHLLRTHLLAEVFAVSLKRNLPRVHPVHKILIRHTHDTLQINVLARQKLISKDGIFTKFTASGGEGMITLLGKSLSNLTYSSLCIPDDIEDRGLGDVKNFYYKEDGLKLWKIMHSFVKETLSYYYEEDCDVKEDDELQNWIKEISVHGFLKETKTENPDKNTTGDQPHTGNTENPEKNTTGDQPHTGNTENPEKNTTGDQPHTGNTENPEKNTTGDQPHTGNTENPEKNTTGDQPHTGNTENPEKSTTGDQPHTGNTEKNPEKSTTGDQPHTGNTEIPQRFETKEELFKFVTMVMFTCSAQHSAVNTGQYDFYGWMPNGPSTMQEPPPTKKGTVTETTIIKALPDIPIITEGMTTVWLLSMQAHDSSFLPDFKQKYFTENIPCDKIRIFQERLLKLSKQIKKRNKGLGLSYTYLDPKLVENSVSI